MKCTNVGCDTQVQQDDMRLVVKAMLCLGCAKRVLAFRDRVRSELEVTLATLDDTLRYILTSDMQFPSDAGATPLEFIAKAQRCRSTPKTTTSSKNTRPGAPTVVGSVGSPKPSVPA